MKDKKITLFKKFIKDIFFSIRKPACIPTSWLKTIIVEKIYISVFIVELILKITAMKKM